MRIYLASFLESDNFGPGKVIGVANGSKPTDIKCDTVFPPLIPSNEIMSNYNDMSVNDPKNAASVFVKAFTDQLEELRNKVQTAADEAGMSPVDMLPFADGDTLASWEREAFTNYRPLIASCLVSLGFDVVQH
jgi:hypothetical protein